MSEYQYYEFQAIDRPLDRAAQKALRAISSRASITAVSFTNHYEWGDFKGDPRKLMEQWFDLHTYLTNWGTRRLMMRLPGRLLDRDALGPFLQEADWAEVWSSGGNLIVDLCRDEVGVDDDWDDGSGWLASIAPLRDDVVSGDLRLFYVVWLTAVQEELVPDEAVEPLPGIGPLTDALEAFAAFFDIDPDLVQAAAESGSGHATLSKDDLRIAMEAITEGEKAELLLRLLEGDRHVPAEIKRKLHGKRSAPPLPRRSVGTLRAKALEIAQARERASVERLKAERLREARQAEEARRTRLRALKQRGGAVWRDIENEIERRNAAGYDKAASHLTDLQALATEEGSENEFARRLAAIRVRHERKAKFLERLAKLGCGSDERTS